jgi:hypothetical protein
MADIVFPNSEEALDTFLPSSGNTIPESCSVKVVDLSSEDVSLNLYSVECLTEI